MKQIKLFVAIGFAFLIMQGCGGSHTDSVEQANDANDMKDSANAPMAMDESDTQFMVEAANDGMMEVECGQQATTKATDQRVKDYAAMMVRDHSKANDELKALAAAKNVTLPTTIGEDKREHLNDMAKKSGRDYDKAYIDMMVDDHGKVISNFEKCAENGKDADLRAWASTTLMTLRMHKDAADSLDKSME